eukprot:5830551-Prymnesium_polylepis.1
MVRVQSSTDTHAAASGSAAFRRFHPLSCFKCLPRCARHWHTVCPRLSHCSTLPLSHHRVSQSPPADSPYANSPPTDSPPPIAHAPIAHAQGRPRAIRRGGRQHGQCASD